MPEHSPVQFPLGSRGRWVETLVLLTIPSFTMYLLACLSLHSQTTSWIGAMGKAAGFIILGTITMLVQGFLSTEHARHIPWIDNAAINLAHGEAREDGIRFRKWFRYHFIAWRAIARLEYWPEGDGRIVLQLYSQQSPVVFIPDSANDHKVSTSAGEGPGTVDFIAQKLGETWPGKSPFLICYEAPHPNAGGAIPPKRRRLSPRQKAWTNAFFMFMFLLFGLSFVGFRWGITDRSFWIPVAAVWALLLIIWIGVRVFGKPVAPSPDQRNRIDRLKASNRS